MSDQKLKVRTLLRIEKTPSEVYEAIVNPDKMSCYFISWGRDRLDAGLPCDVAAVLSNNNGGMT